VPLKMAAQLGLCENSRLLITVRETEKRMILRPTREMLPIATVAEMERMQAAMRRQPAGTWQYICALDDRRRVILPRSMHEWLGWSEETRLRVGSNGDVIFLEEDILNNAKQ